MYKKIITLLFSLSLVFTLFAQQDFDENAAPVKSQVQIEAMWDVLAQFDVTLISGAAGNAGAEWDGTHFYTTRWASNLIHEYNMDGTLSREFSVPGVTGLRDLAYDGQYFYGGAAANTIYQMDFGATPTLIGTIPSTQAVRHIAYDSDLDAFWVGNWSTPIVCIDRSGTQLFSIPADPVVTSNYGSAYDNVSAGGPYLWVWSQGGGAGTPQFIHQLHLPDGAVTGVSHDVLTDVGVGGTLSIAGGLFTMTDFASGFFTIGGLLQGNPIGDQLFVYEVEPAGTSSNFTDNFDSYTAGVQLCLQTTDWEPWFPAVPGGAEDPFVSNLHSFSSPNTVVIVSGNDLVRRHGPVTTGKWYISFAFYIPAGNSGYFNTMNDYDPGVNTWGMDSYFDVGGVGRLDTTGGGGATFNVPFTWLEDTWNQVIVIIDLDAPGTPAEYWLGQDPSSMMMVATWDWTQAGTKPTQIAVNDLYGAAATDEMYVDQFWFGDAMPPIIPVELTSFTAIANNGIVELNWETATEINNQGFEIERRTETSEFRTIGFVEGN
ncbi:MAG: hypothetical protein OQJ78_00190, partial [Ignavibacteriaceae bacterium]|nr:hypothetical protein [Ignavibacteriaceae bacterium]